MQFLLHMGLLIISVSGFLCLFFLSLVAKFITEVWWRPIHLQSMLRSQKVQGPAYRFIHGNTKEIAQMRMETKNRSKELSHQVLPAIQPHIYNWKKLYGMNFLCWYGTRPQLVVTDPELVKEVLTSKENVYAKIPFQEFIRILLGDGLILSTGEKWSKMRKLATHAFHAESLKSMIPAMIESVEMMLQNLSQNEGKEIEVFKEFKILTSEVISRTAFGSSYKEGQKIFDMLKKMGLVVARNHFKAKIPVIKKLFKTRDDIESDKLQHEIRNSILKIAKKREEEMLSGRQDGYGSDFLGHLLKAYNEQDKAKKISADDLIDECKTFYVAGQETTVSSLTWAVFLLAMYTDWQEKARNEVFELFGQENPTTDGIGRLKTMSMIINESLRLYPPVIGATRMVQQNCKLGRILLPAKIEVCIPIVAVHHSPEIWGEDAQIFKPERFAGGVAKATNNMSSAFIPFSLGPRTCVGMNFAITEIKIALSMILQRYRFSLSPTYVHSPTTVLTISPEHGLQIMLEKL